MSPTSRRSSVSWVIPMSEHFRTRDEELAYLRRRTRELEDKIEQLEYTIASRLEVDEFEALTIMEHFNVSFTRAQIIWLLASGRPLTRDRIMDEYALNREIDHRDVDSQIKRIRQVCTEIPIKSIYGYGYQMEPEGVRRIKQIVAEAKAKHKAEKSEPEA